VAARGSNRALDRSHDGHSTKGRETLALTRGSLLAGVRSRWVAVLVVMTAVSVSVVAVGQEKAVLVGSTSPAFLREAVGQVVDKVSPIEGTIDVGSDLELTFDAGSRWSAKVPYAAITHLTMAWRPADRSAAFDWRSHGLVQISSPTSLTTSSLLSTAIRQVPTKPMYLNLARSSFDRCSRRWSVGQRDAWSS